MAFALQPPEPQPLFSEILAGSRSLRVLTSLAISAVVTAVVVVPMALRANDYVPEVDITAPATPDQIILDTPQDDPGPLSNATVSGNVLISLQNPFAAAATFVMAPVDGLPIAQRTDAYGPNFDFLADDEERAVAIDTTQFADGEYDLFITITTLDNREDRTATRFRIENGQVTS